MPFKHLFLYPNHRMAQVLLFQRLEEISRYTAISEARYGRRTLTMAAHDGQHEITVGSVEEIEYGRFRGMNFDKVSIHETVELTQEIHEFLRFVLTRNLRGFNFDRIIVDEMVPNDRVYFVNDGWAKDILRRIEDDRLDAMRYLWLNIEVTVPEYKGIVGDLSI